MAQHIRIPKRRGDCLGFIRGYQANIGFSGSLNWNGRSAPVCSSEISPGLRSIQDFIQVGYLGLALIAAGWNRKWGTSLRQPHFSHSSN